MDEWDEALSETALRLSYVNAEYMVVSRDQRQGTIAINGNALKRTETFSYLGSVILSSNTIERD